MSAVTREWLAVILFLAAFAGSSVAEAAWLRRAGWRTMGRAIVFSLSTNLVGFGIGLVTSFTILGIILAIAWDGSINDMPGHDSTLWMTMVAAVFITPVLLTVIKRFLLWLLKIRTGLPAWIFSFSASILVFAVTLGLPIVVLYLL